MVPNAAVVAMIVNPDTMAKPAPPRIAREPLGEPPAAEHLRAPTTATMGKAGAAMQCRRRIRSVQYTTLETIKV